MKTVYSNSRRPDLVKRSCWIAGILGVLLLILYVILDNDYAYLLSIASWCLLYSVLFYGQYKLRRYEIDEENDTITDFAVKKYPLHISQLTTATYKESKKGKFRSLFLHDAGIGFMDIRTSKENADKMVAQLLGANPSIEVKHAHYI